MECKQISKKQWLNLGPFLGESIRDIGLTFRYYINDQKYLLDVIHDGYNPVTNTDEVKVQLTPVEIVDDDLATFHVSLKKPNFDPFSPHSTEENEQYQHKSNVSENKTLSKHDHNLGFTYVEGSVSHQTLMDLCNRALLGHPLSSEEKQLVRTYFLAGSLK